jgi:hypothetical protein
MGAVHEPDGLRPRVRVELWFGDGKGERKCADSGERNALRMRDRALRAGLDVGSEYVRSGGIRAGDEPYVGLLGEYGDVQDRLSPIVPGEGEVEVLTWPDRGDWFFDRVWEGQ